MPSNQEIIDITIEATKYVIGKGSIQPNIENSIRARVAEVVKGTAVTDPDKQTGLQNPSLKSNSVSSR